jgi:hypothetical protein
MACLLFAAMAFPAAVFSDDRMTITVGTPTKEGEDTVRVWVRNKTIEVKIKVVKDIFGNLALDDGLIRSAATAENKRNLIVKKLKEKGVDAAPQSTNRVVLKETFGRPRFGGIVMGTGQYVKYSSLDPISSVFAYALAAGSSSLSGLDGFDNEAIYTAGVGFTDPVVGDINVSSSFLFSDLLDQTIDGVLNQIFDDLSSELTSLAPSIVDNLNLDIASREIDFLYPSIASDGFVEIGTTDTELVGTLSLTSIPEPSTVMLLVSGAFCLFLLKVNLGRTIRCHLM